MSMNHSASSPVLAQAEEFGVLSGQASNLTLKDMLFTQSFLPRDFFDDKDKELREAAAKRLREAKQSKYVVNRDNVQVYVRVKPDVVHDDDKKEAALACLEIQPDERTVKMVGRDEFGKPISAKDREFKCDGVLPGSASQEDVYERIFGSQIVDSYVQGMDCAVLGYGMLNTGKTHTLYAPSTRRITQHMDPGNLLGVFPRLARDIFARIAMERAIDPDVEINVHCNFIELYLDKLRDLLTVEAIRRTQNMKQRVLEETGGVWFPEATMVPLRTEEDLLNTLVVGNRHRVVEETVENMRSSRSHAILIVTLQKFNEKTEETSVSRFFMADLAGAHYMKTFLNQNGSHERITEAQNINQQLNALTSVMRALTAKKKFVPVRNSKLTMVLQDVLGGNSKAVFLVTISQQLRAVHETIATLNFAVQAKSLPAAPRVKKSMSVKEVKMLTKLAKNEIARLTGIIRRYNSEAEVMRKIQRLRDPLNASLTSSGDPKALGSVAAEKKALLQEDISVLAQLSAIDDQSGLRNTYANDVKVALEQLEAFDEEEGKLQQFSAQAALTHVGNDYHDLLAFYTCPLSGVMMTDPAVAMDGVTYQRAAIEKHFKACTIQQARVSPVTGQAMRGKALLANKNMLQQIRKLWPEYFTPKGDTRADVPRPAPVLAKLDHSLQRKIISFLSKPSDILPLALTCKNFYFLLSPVHLPTSKAAAFNVV
jgi:hypothetical protein